MHLRARRRGPAASRALAGSIVAGAAIGIIGVLLPGLVKREFADRAATTAGSTTEVVSTTIEMPSRNIPSRM